MIRNYIKVALRNLWKKSTHSLINIIGLSLGIASCLLVFIYVRNELTYDRFHENLSGLYRINMRSLDSNNEWEEYGITSPVMAPEFELQVPELSATMRLSRYRALTRHNGELQHESFSFIDPALLDYFSFPLTSGDLKDFRDDPNSILITEETAKRLFPDKSPIGQTLEMEFNGRYEILTVKGVIKDIPFNSSIRFSMVLPYSKYQQIARPGRFTEWLDQHIATFVFIKNKIDRPALEQKLTQILQSHISEGEPNGFQVTLQPLADIHLNDNISGGNGVQPSTSFTTSWLLIGIGAFLLLIAAINFINISIALALPRTKEIGLRKVAGARRPQIISQFLGEALITSLAALLIAVAFVDLFLPAFERMTNRSLVTWEETNVSLVAAVVIALLITALLAGIYPAIVVSRFNPVKSLKGQEKVGGGNFMMKGLILLQFILGIMFFLGSLTVQNQLRFIENFDLGYDDHGLVWVSGFGENGNALIDKFRNELATSPYVKSVSANSGSSSRTGFTYLGKEYEVNHDRVDHNFFNTHNIKLLEGRSFNPESPTDKTGAVIVNEAFVRMLDLKNPVGTRVPFTYGSGMVNPVIIGIMPDFHYASLKQKVDPMVFYVDPEIELGQFLVRLDSEKLTEGVEAVHTAWGKLVPHRPFQYGFVEEVNQRYYATEQKQKEIISYASFFALFISCLGLFGLTNLTISQRAKEIGIRKILGATMKQITWLVSSEFIMIVLAANVVAWPVAWYFLDDWLSTFSYHINLSWLNFLLAGGLALLIACVTVSVQSLKSALANPVDSLRNE